MAIKRGADIQTQKIPDVHKPDVLMIAMSFHCASGIIEDIKRLHDLLPEQPQRFSWRILTLPPAHSLSCQGITLGSALLHCSLCTHVPTDLVLP